MFTNGLGYLWEETLLSDNKSEGSTFCGTGSNCNSDNWGTFSINPIQKAFKYRVFKNSLTPTFLYE